MEPYYLGTDVSKGYADFVIINKQKSCKEPNFQLDDTRKGHHELEQVLKKFFTQNPQAVLYAAVESTGGYENNWFKFLKDLSQKWPVKVVRINPKGIRHDGEAALHRTTNDKISARTVAEYQINHPDKLQYNQDDAYKTLKRAFTVLQGMVKAKSQFLGQLETLLYSAHPELMSFRRSGTPQWLLRLLLSYPTAASLAKATVAELTHIPYLPVAKARKLITLAQHSVASVSDNTTASSIKRLASIIITMDEHINQELKQLQKGLSVPQLDLLMTFKGIGLYSAMALLVEIGPIERFATAKHLASFLGLHPIHRQSGDGVWGMHMSKQGRKKARAILYMIALNAIKNNLYIQTVYQKQLQKGKAKKSALGVCMHKILRIIYGMLKNNQPFDENIDRRNQQREQHRQKVQKPKADRRYQSEDPQAPISYRQSKKRKERERSQGELVTMHEITIPAPLNPA